MNAVVRQRRANARRIAQATAVTAAAVVLSGGVAHASAPGELRPRTGGSAKADSAQGLERRDRGTLRDATAATAVPAGTLTALPFTAGDRADAVSGAPTAIDLLLAAGLPTERALAALTATPEHGGVVLNDDATATYTSVPGYAGPDSFAYRFTDDRGHTSRVTVAVTVSHGDQPVSGYAAAA